MKTQGIVTSYSVKVDEYTSNDRNIVVSVIRSHKNGENASSLPQLSIDELKGLHHAIEVFLNSQEV